MRGLLFVRDQNRQNRCPPGLGLVKDTNLPDRVTVEARFSSVSAESANDKTNRERDGVHKSWNLGVKELP